MTCKDCLHYELCRYNTFQEAHYFGKDKEIYITIDNNLPCKYFTDRSEWVHLPCNIEKTVYFIRNSKIIETAVEKIVIKKNGIYLKLSCNVMYETSCKSIGKTVFFDREEAEKALKEYEIND